MERGDARTNPGTCPSRKRRADNSSAGRVRPGAGAGSHRPDRIRPHRDRVTATGWVPPTAGSSTSDPGAGFFGSRLSPLVCRRSTCSSTTASLPVALCDLN